MTVTTAILLLFALTWRALSGAISVCAWRILGLLRDLTQEGVQPLFQRPE